MNADKEAPLTRRDTARLTKKREEASKDEKVREVRADEFPPPSRV